MRPPRIGIAGSAGTGKTTLAGMAAARLGLPLHEEPMRARLAAGFDLHALTREGHRALLRADALDLARRAAGDAGLVADRTPLDYAAFWLCNGFAVEDPAATAALLEAAVAAVADFTLVVLAPWGVLAPEADGVRSTDPWHQLHFHAVVAELARRWVPPSRLLALPDAPLAPEARLALLLERLGSGEAGD
ncbi:MAG TPA: AAA family ATPase [Azospirillaceae bacterium]|nr:AAA family ATPase [Azospirillaceae bacterium]